MDGPCPPEEYPRLLEARRMWGLRGWALGIPSVFLLGFGLGGQLLLPDRGDVLFAPFIGLPLHVLALAAYARCKGRSAAWGLLAAGCVFGWIVLRFLPLHRACGGPL